MLAVAAARGVAPGPVRVSAWDEATVAPVPSPGHVSPACDALELGGEEATTAVTPSWPGTRTMRPIAVDEARGEAAEEAGSAPARTATNAVASTARSHLLTRGG
jgi:hypothetical protein